MVQRTLHILLLLVLALTLGACSRRADQSTPQAVLDSAKAMVESGKADRLSDLIWADSPEMRRVLDELGVAFGSLQELGEELERQFPDEVQEIKDEAREGVESGKASGVLGSVFRGVAPVVRDDDRNNPGAIATRALRELFANPYGFLEEQSDRLTVVPMTDDMAALQWDGKPVFGPLVGMTMRKKDGKWYVALPTHIPQVQRVMPKTKDGWEILESLVMALDNTIVDTTEAVRSGEARTLNEAATIAGENTLIPIMLIMVSYGTYMEELEESEESAPQSNGG